MSKKGPKGKSPPPPDNERCKRNDGKHWRCKHRRSEGESMCDYHSQYARNRLGSATKPNKSDSKNSGRENEVKGGIKEVKSVEKSSSHSGHLEASASSSYSRSDRSVTSHSASFTSSEGPSVAKPSVVKPSAVKPPVVKPPVVKPSAVKPSVANSSVVKTSIAKPSVVKPSHEVVPSTSVVPGAKRRSRGGDSNDIASPVKIMTKKHHSEMNTDTDVPSYNEIFDRIVSLNGNYKKWEIFDLVNNVEMRRHFNLLEDEDARAYVEYHVRKMRREDAQS